jgi:hypothetical protein
MKRNRFIIIGAGSIGLELLKKLPRDYSITCIDMDRFVEETVKKLRPDIEFINGDATSRLVLETARVEEADCIILTIPDDKFNIEAARVLREHFKAGRIISVGFSGKSRETLGSMDVEVEDIFTASAVGIRNRLEQKSRAAHAIGIGKNEILEVEVHPNSRLANRTIGSISPNRLRIGIIYRAENIIIPTANTVLKPRDKVVILGDPAVLRTFSDLLTFNFERFPLEYGSTVVIYLAGGETEGFFKEVNYLCSTFPMTRKIFVVSKKARKKLFKYEGFLAGDNETEMDIIETVLPPLKALEKTFDDIDQRQGLVALSREIFIDSYSQFLTNFGKKTFIKKLSATAGCPVLLSAQTHPYKQIMAPCVEGVDGQAVLELSLEISSAINNTVTAVLVRPSGYISSEDEMLDFDGLKKRISDTALIYRQSVKTLELEGNPVKAVGAASGDFNLMVMDTEGFKLKRFFSIVEPDVAWYVLKACRVSTLFIPKTIDLL